MFARFRNLFAKSKADDELPTIVVDEAPTEQPNADDAAEEQITLSAAPLASEEEDLSIDRIETLSNSTQELSQLLDAINLSSKLPDLSSEDTEHDEDEDDDTASTSSVKTKIAKASIERDIILEETEEEGEEEKAPQQRPLQSLDKIKALIRNDSETYPHSDYTDQEDATPPSHSRTASQDSTASHHDLLPCDYSIVPDELPLDSPATDASPLHDSGRNSSAGSESFHQIEAPSPSTVTVTPTGSNELACAAISHKLSAIAEVAESLDAVIRDCSAGDVDLSKKLGSNGMSSEDWQSRSTEDDSFATASEGNFTPNSHSSSFQTASGRTSSYIGSAKNSFDEADDSTLSNFEIPELPQSPVNMSFDSSELSYFSAQQPPLLPVVDDDDQDSVVGVAELHSQSVTPTPEVQEALLAHPIESDSELEAYGLDSNVIRTELLPSVSTAVTPEVSSQSTVVAVAATNNEQKTTTTSNASLPPPPPPPAAWRRSKYYENITKQTIKGFL